jgi:nucleoside-diphosphate-sugar epimerase
MSDKPTVGIIGASGFIGSRVVEWLALRDLAQVRPIVRSFKSMARLSRFDLDCRVADATDQAALKTQLEGCKVLFHSVVGQRDTILKSAESAYRAAADAGVRRLVYLSSGMVHGHNPAPGTNDDSKLLARQPIEYNVSKVMAEHLLRRLRADGAVEVVTLRPVFVFGPRSQYFTIQIAMDLLSGRAYLIDEGVGICNTIYVDNLVYAMWQAATTVGAGNQDFIITDGEKVTWRDLYSAVAEAVGVDMASVPNIESAALTKLYREQRLAQLKSTGKRFGWAMRESLPSSVINTARGILPSSVTKTFKPLWTSFQTPGSISIQKENGKHPLPVIDREIANWQCCHYLLPIEKARNVLGYEPQVTFSEGCRKTSDWIRFAFGMGEGKA